MTVVVLDADAVIRHGRTFPETVRRAVEHVDAIVLPGAVKRELVDDVLDGNPPENHRRSAESIQALVEAGVLDVRDPDFDRSSGVIDEARRRIADETLPEHHVKADQYIPAIVCELAEEGPVQLVTGDAKLAATVRVLAEKQRVADTVSIHDPLTVLYERGSEVMAIDAFERQTRASRRSSTTRINPSFGSGSTGTSSLPAV